MSQYELAQLNIAVMKEPLDSPVMADFVANLERINALPESSPGFVWRLKTDEGDATALRPLGDSTLVNMSVWKSVADLNQYVYKSAHVEIMRRRKEWFERMSEASIVMWWVPNGHRPPSCKPSKGCSCCASTARRQRHSRSGTHSRRPMPTNSRSPSATSAPQPESLGTIVQ